MLTLIPYFIPIFSTIIVVQLKNNYGVLYILLYMQIKKKNYQIKRYTGGNQRDYLVALNVVKSFINCYFQQ
jgi:hypothetical protein